MATRQARGGTLIIGGGFAGAYVARLLGERGARSSPGELHALHAAAARGGVRDARAAPRRRAAAPDVPARRAPARPGDRARRAARTVAARPTRRHSRSATSTSCSRSAPCRVRCPSRAREHAVGFKDLADAIELRNHVLRQLEAADVHRRPAEAARHLGFVFVGAGYAGVEALAELSDLVRDALRFYPRLREVTAALGARRCGARDPPGDPAAARRVRGTRALRRAASRSTSRRRSSPYEAATPCSRTGRPCRRGRSSGPRASAPTRCSGRSASRSTSAAASPSTSSFASRATRASGRSATARACRTPARPASSTRRRASTRSARPAGSRRTSRATRSRTATGCSARSRHSALQGDRRRVGLRLRGFPGWLVTRSYHLFQLPLLTRKLRVVADWTTSLFFRRDVAELSVLGHPHRLGDRALAELPQRGLEPLPRRQHALEESPCSATRAGTTSIVNAAGSSGSSTSSQRSGVETGAPAFGRTE